LAPTLVLICGVPGSGKTTIAKILSRMLGNSIHIQSDAIRFMMARPRYTHKESAFVYDVCTDIARKALDSGYHVVLDATFLRNDYRRRALEALRPLCESQITVCLVCDPEVAYGRNRSREAQVPRSRFAHLISRYEVPLDCLKIDTTAMRPEEAALLVKREMEKQTVNITVQRNFKPYENKDFGGAEGS